MRKTVALLASMAAVVVLANMVALATIPNTARAAFPGKNGDIIYSDNTCPPAGGRCSFPIIRMNGDGSGKRTLGDFKGTNPDWSADGQKIAFTGYRVPAIYTMNADGSARRRLTDGARGEVSPAWFPDGRKIAFYQYGPNGRPKGAFSENIWAAGLDEQGRPTGRLTRLTSNSADEIDPAISPDGKWIVFASNRSSPPASGFNNKYDIFVMRAGAPEGPDNRPRNLTAKLGRSAVAPDWSPNGKKILFTRRFLREGEGLSGIYEMNVDGSGKRELAVSPHYFDFIDAVWSPNGKQIAYGRETVREEEIWRMRADGSRKVRLTTAENVTGGPDWQPLPGPAPPERCTISGTSGVDNLVGTNGRDVICARGGPDTVLGKDGNDILYGGRGPDVLMGGAGRDVLYGGAGTDSLVGGPGEDRLVGGPGLDVTIQ